MEIAKAAIKAHGGEKFKNVKSLVFRGTGDVSISPEKTFSAPFHMIHSGDKYRLEIAAPFMEMKQVYDGDRTISSLANFKLPPLNRLGLWLLPKIEDKDFTVSPLPNKSKKLGFRITSPEGDYTDFFVDEKTMQIVGYEAKYDYNRREVKTSVSLDKLREVEGCLFPEHYSQSFDVGEYTIYAKFKAKEILVNSFIADDVFVER
ncbi:MAG: hypothetical protein ACRD6X_12130 [Pyrinomonadaceae bacterium]